MVNGNINQEIILKKENILQVLRMEYGRVIIPTENLKFKGNFVQGNPDGEHRYYYENGKLREEQHFEMGIRQKTWKKFDEEGNIVTRYCI